VTGEASIDPEAALMRGRYRTERCCQGAHGGQWCADVTGEASIDPEAALMRSRYRTERCCQGARGGQWGADVTDEASIDRGRHELAEHCRIDSVAMRCERRPRFDRRDMIAAAREHGRNPRGGHRKALTARRTAPPSACKLAP
jgi:hypothetical protein